MLLPLIFKANMMWSGDSKKVWLTVGSIAKIRPGIWPTTDQKRLYHLLCELVKPKWKYA